MLKRNKDTFAKCYHEDTRNRTHSQRGMSLQKKTRILYFQSTVMICRFFSNPLTISSATLVASSCIGYL